MNRDKYTFQLLILEQCDMIDVKKKKKLKSKDLFSVLIHNTWQSPVPL